MATPEQIRSVRADEGVTSTLYDDGVMHLDFHRGVLIDEVVARAARRTQEELTDDAYVLVVDATKLAYMEADAMEFLATEPRRKQLALAIVVGPRITRFVVERATTDHEYDRPVAIFFDPAEAWSWARRKAAEFRTDGLMG